MKQQMLLWIIFIQLVTKFKNGIIFKKGGFIKTYVQQKQSNYDLILIR